MDWLIIVLKTGLVFLVYAFGLATAALFTVWMVGRVVDRKRRVRDALSLKSRVRTLLTVDEVGLPVPMGRRLDTMAAILAISREQVEAALVDVITEHDHSTLPVDGCYCWDCSVARDEKTT